MEISIYSPGHLPEPIRKQAILDFLHVHLEQFGDPIDQIEKAFDYAMGKQQSPGGFVIVAETADGIMGATIVNRTGMEGYIPENILVYIAAHKNHRGEGIGKLLMNEVVRIAEGSIALHVEHDNPAMHLYRKLGFTNKYLEMRLNRKKQHGTPNA